LPSTSSRRSTIFPSRRSPPDGARKTQPGFRRFEEIRFARALPGVTPLLVERHASAINAASAQAASSKKEKTMSLLIGETAPDFTAETTEGRIHFYDWLGDSWGILFSHPKDFTPVCTTELGYMAKLKPEFDKRNVKIIGLSVDPVERHKGWAKDIEETQGHAPNYPMIGDTDLSISKAYQMLPATAGVTSEGRTAVDNQTVRNVYVIGPDKKIKLVISYPMAIGRNFDEILRVVDSLQLTAKHKVSTPVNWKQGEDVIIVPAVSDEDAKKLHPQGWKTLKPYLRVVAQPKG
jgi:alkyl hydroperoxide reductase subunit AhpC